MIYIFLIILLVVSFVWAYFTTKKDFSKPKEIRHVKKELAREKILFKR